MARNAAYQKGSRFGANGGTLAAQTAQAVAGRLVERCRAASPDFFSEGLVSPTDSAHARRCVEQSLCTLEHFSPLVFEHLPYAVFWKNSSFEYLGCNRRFAALFGQRSPERIRGSNDYSLPWPDHKIAAEFRLRDKLALLNGRTQTYPLEFDHPLSGEHLWLSVSVVPLNDLRVGAGLVGFIENVSKHKRTQKALAQCDARLRNMLRHLPATVWTVDHDLNLCLLTGRPLPGLARNRGARRPSSLYELAGPDEKDTAAMAGLVRAALGGISSQGTVVCRGKRFHALVEPLREPGRGIVGAVGLLLDNA